MIEGRIGMFVVETITWIRRAHLVQGKLIKAICRELRVSRKTVRNVIRLKATEFHYERDEQPMPRLGAWREMLDGLLAANEAKLSRERLILIRLPTTIAMSLTRRISSCASLSPISPFPF